MYNTLLIVFVLPNVITVINVADYINSLIYIIRHKFPQPSPKSPPNALIKDCPH